MSAPCTAERHGDATARRNYNCRCPAAIAAHTRAIKKWRLRKQRNGGVLTIDATGARRRLQALARIGHDFQSLTNQHGLARDVCNAIAHGRRTDIRIATHRRVAAIYDALYAEDGPSIRASRRAERLGWHGPEAWTDDTIDDPKSRPWQGFGPRRKSSTTLNETAIRAACAGQRVDTTIADRREIVRRLHAAGLNDRQIQRRTGISARTALRIRGQLGLSANDRADRQTTARDEGAA